MKSMIDRLSHLSVRAALLLSLVATAQVPNASFEQWTGCVPDEWATGNVCGLLTPVTKSSTAHSGSWAARGEVVSFFGQPIQPVLQSGPTGEGTPISQRYVALQGSYLFSPLGGDRFAVNVVFLRNGDVVAQGAVANPAAAGTYTPFTVTMNYVSPDVPDTAIIQFQIVGPVTGSDFHIGSVMHIDSLAYTTNSVSSPSLSIQRHGSSLIVSWPAEVTGYTLQSTPTLGPATWANVSGVVNNSYQVTPAGKAFFRLIK